MIHGQGCARGLVTMMLTAACWASMARAQLREGDALTPVIGNLPLSTKLVIVSAKPSAVLGELKGPWKLLGPVASGLGGDTLSSWGLLSRRLGYTPGEAFGELTSGGLALVVADPTVTVAAGGDKPGPQVGVDARWAVLSVVKREVAVRVRERLKAVPHEVIGGRPVLSVEDGRFALVCRALTDAEGCDEVLALTPTEDRAFLESVVAAVEAARPRAGDAGPRVAEPTLASTAAFARGKQTAADVLLLAPEGKPGQAWEKASVVACGLGARAWTFDIEQVGSAAGPSPAVERVPAEAVAWFDAWSPGAAVMFVSGGQAELNAQLSAAAPQVLPADERVEGLGFFAGARGEPGSGLSVWAGARLSGSDRSHADAIDAMGEQIVRLIESGDWLKKIAGGADPRDGKEGKEPDAAVPSPYGAAGPMGLRVATVKIHAGDNFLPAGQGDATPTPGSVAWFQCVPDGSAGAERDPRWLVWGVEPTQEGEALAARHGELKRLLTGAAATERPWLLRSVVRPPRVLEALPAPLAFAAGLTGAGAVKEIRFESWDVQPADGGGARARVVVEWGGAAGPVERAKP